MVFFHFMMNILNFLVKIILIYSQDILKAVPNFSCPETKHKTQKAKKGVKQTFYIDNYKNIAPTAMESHTRECFRCLH